MRLARVRRATIAMAAIVALVTLPSGIACRQEPEQVRLRRLRSLYVAKAARHAELEHEFEQLSNYQDFSKAHLSAFRGGKLVHLLNPQLPELVPKYIELAKYHGSLKEKYERAAANPWLTVIPDAPRPAVP